MFKSLVWLDLEKIPALAGFEPGIFRSRGGRLTTWPMRRWEREREREGGRRKRRTQKKKEEGTEGETDRQTMRERANKRARERERGGGRERERGQVRDREKDSLFYQPLWVDAITWLMRVVSAQIFLKQKHRHRRKICWHCQWWNHPPCRCYIVWCIKWSTFKGIQLTIYWSTLEDQ